MLSLRVLVQQYRSQVEEGWESFQVVVALLVVGRSWLWPCLLRACPTDPQWRALPPAHASIQNVSDTLECVMVLSHWSSMQSAFTCARINTKCVRHVGIRYGFVPLVLNGERFHLRTHQWHCVRHVGMRYGFVPLVLNGEHCHLRTHQWQCVRHVEMRYDLWEQWWRHQQGRAPRKVCPRYWTL